MFAKVLSAVDDFIRCRGKWFSAFANLILDLFWVFVCVLFSSLSRSHLKCHSTRQVDVERITFTEPSALGLILRTHHSSMMSFDFLRIENTYFNTNVGSHFRISFIQHLQTNDDKEKPVYWVKRKWIHLCEILAFFLWAFVFISFSFIKFKWQSTMLVQAFGRHYKWKGNV